MLVDIKLKSHSSFYSDQLRIHYPSNLKINSYLSMLITTLSLTLFRVQYFTPRIIMTFYRFDNFFNHSTYIYVDTYQTQISFYFFYEIPMSPV